MAELIALTFTEKQILCLAQVLSRTSKRTKELALDDLAEWDVFRRAQDNITSAADNLIHQSRSNRR